MTRVAYVYPNSRRAMIAGWRAGTAPETHLLGLNQLGEFGIHAEAREPRIESRGTGLAARATWHLREVTLPWELRDFDVIFTPLANVVPLASRARRKPHVLILNFGLNTILRRAGSARRALLVASLRASRGVVCLGDSQRDELVRLSGLPESHVPVAVHGVDDRFFDPGRERPGELVVAVGKDLARDYRTLAEAARGLEARVVCVARRRNLQGVDLPPNVDVRERISDDEVRELYARAGCVVVPLRRPEYPYGSEGSGVTALLEAESMARPLVVSDRPIVRDYVDAGDTGIIVPPEDPDALRAAVRSVLADPAAAAEMGRRGRARVLDRHTMRHMAADLAPLMKAAA